jgi:hypothetical protein
MVRSFAFLMLTAAVGGCQSAPTVVSACQLVQDPAAHVGKAVTIEDMALPAPGGTIAITAVRGCRIQNVQGIELDLSEAEAEGAEALRRNLAEGRRRSRPNHVYGVAGRFTGTVEQGFEGALTLHLRRAENQQVRRADNMLQPGLYDLMSGQGEADSVYVSNTVR